MHPFFFCQQFFYGFAVHFVRNTAVNRANGGTLGLLMKTLAFGAFGWNDVIGIHSDRGITLASVYHRAINQGKTAFYFGAIGNGPFHSTLVNRIVWAFRFAGSAIDTFFCDLYSHNFSLLVSELVLQQK
jgi:hypothetical protein